MSDFYDQNELMAAFEAECEECLASLEESLVSLESAPSAETINTIFRVAHTLKGTSATVGFPSLAGLGHSMENVLDGIREGTLTVSSAVISLLLRAGDSFRTMLPQAIAGAECMSEEAAEVIAELDAFASGTTLPAFTGETPAAISEVEGNAAADGLKNRRIRVGLDKLDSLLDLTGEIVVSLVRLRSDVERLKGSGPALESLAETETLLTDFQEQVMNVRMLPVAVAFEPHRRTVRDVATSTGKQVRLVIEGADVEVDAAIIEHIKDPLTHLVRNAVDHGIETPAERLRRGKAAEGTVTLRASRQSGYVVIEIADDGAGLDHERILARAHERRLVDANHDWSDAEVHRLLFLPGFSTNDAVSDVSGRGVGLDVVARNVRALRGHIEIENREGLGTTFILRLPLTLAILPGLAVESANERFVIPLDAIDECLQAPPRMGSEEMSGLIDIRGEAIPYLRLSSYYELRKGAAEHESVVVVGSGRKRVGLIIDSLIGEMQTVIKPIGPLLQRIPGMAGSTLFGDGRIGLVLDVPTLLRDFQALRQPAGPRVSPVA
jgi:two-component system chemotaxis sensor kinase CheA